MKCPICEFDNAASAKFCSECGTDLVAAVDPLAQASQSPGPSWQGSQEQEGFPEEEEVEYEKSIITIPLYLKRDPRRLVDTMQFDAYMRLIRGRPLRNSIGYRQFEFQIDEWELTNVYSKGLDANVTFTLSDTVQPKSICIALQKESDFPALIVYSAIYDVYLDTERIVTNQPGVAFATGVLEIPPRNVTVAFQKPFESDIFGFDSGTCGGMRSIARPDFEEGAARGRSFRSRRQGPPRP